MALPTKTEIQALDTTWRGLPFCRVEAKTMSTANLDTTWRGLPFYAAPATGGFFARNYYDMISQSRLGS